MSDEYSIFGQLSQLNPSGKPRDAKEVPLDKDSRRRPKRKKKDSTVVSKEDPEPEEAEKNETDRRPSGKVVDILI